MLDPKLIAFESRAVTLLGSLGIFSDVTRRKLGFLPPKTPWFEVDVTVTPADATGHLRAAADVELRTEMRLAGRGTSSTALLDGMRFRADLALERLLGDAELSELWADIRQTSWNREVDIDDGAFVVVETVELRSHLRHTVGVGSALGAIAGMQSAFGAGTSSAGAANAALAAPVVYHEGLDTVLVAPASISALFAGTLDDATQRLELRDSEDSVIASIDITATAGVHAFTGVAAGDYNLTTIEIATSDVLAQSPQIRVRAAP